MATKISEMTSVSSVKDTDIIPILSGGTTNAKATMAVLKKYCAPAPSTPTSSGIDWNGTTETTSPGNDDYILINQGGVQKKVKIGTIKGAENLTEEYLELTGDDGEKYRLSILNGKLIALPASAFTKTAPNPGDQALYRGLMINSMYGTGTSSTCAISHSFVELYNARNEVISLKGLCLWYKAGTGAWEKIPLSGAVLPKHSFLIRGALQSNNARYIIEDYDMSIDKKFSTDGFTMFLAIENGETVPPENPTRTYLEGGTVKKETPGYIDMLGAGGIGGQGIAAYEGSYLNCMSDHSGVRRIDFMNSLMASLSSADLKSVLPDLGSNAATKGNNVTDCMAIDYNTCNLNIYRPRYSGDGEWSSYVDKPELKATCPNMMNICYGKNGDTSRTFTWQTKGVTKQGFIKIRKIDSSGVAGNWVKYESTREIVTLLDGDITIHRVIVHNLEYSVYEYQAGEEGAWSDIEKFEVVKYSNSRPIKILQTSDEQGWTELEYSASKTSAKAILDPSQENHFDFDFHLNTGDISQNGSRSFEWRFYFENYADTLRTKPHMTCCGNNDLMGANVKVMEKSYSTAFHWYSTQEDQKFNSTYSFDLGFAHFTCLSAWDDLLYHSTDPDNVNTFAGTDEFFNAITKWFDEDLTAALAREQKPRWLIVYAHLSPFTVQRLDRLQRWVSICEKHKVDLFICGHNHAYSRSIPLYTGYNAKVTYNAETKKWTMAPYNDLKIKNNIVKVVDEFKADGSTPINMEPDKANGTVYVMSNATSFKLTGKEKPMTLSGSGITFMKNGVALSDEEKKKYLSKATPSDPDGIYNASLCSGAPWWVAAQGNTKQPNFITYEIGWDRIEIKSYEVSNVKYNDDAGNNKVREYNPETNKLTLYDSYTIEYNPTRRS